MNNFNFNIMQHQDEVDAYLDAGYRDRSSYLQAVADDYGMPYHKVFQIASLLGSNEDFDGLLSTLEEAFAY